MPSYREFYYSEADLKLQIPCAKATPNSKLQQTEFDREFLDVWQDYMEKGLTRALVHRNSARGMHFDPIAGHFRYEIQSPETRILKGRFGYVVQLSPNRASNRRPPQAMLHLEQPFCHQKFNFTKIDEEKEVIFELKTLSGIGRISTARKISLK